MHLSYEGGAGHGGGLNRVRLLAPLRHRDFRLLWSGMCVSLLGDGIFLVAMAWQVYALSNAPTALAIVGITMTVPTIAFLLLGGVVSDRFDRRRVMVAADVLRGLAVGLMALLCLTGVLELWHIAALAAAGARSQGAGGVSATARATGLSRRTIQRGLRELDGGSDPGAGRVRRAGAG
ncbi:MAG: MFS transporter, partial [Solirubrobacteraceae bacterium]